jgi:hypothetical protein
MRLLITNLSQNDFNEMSISYKIIEEVTDKTKTMSGCIYTALLAAMYLPAGLLTETRLKALDSTGNGKDDPVSPLAITRIINLAAGIAPFAFGTSLDILEKIKIG